MAYKLGFRWRTVDFPVDATPLDTPPPCHFDPFRTGPIFDSSPALNVIPTMLDRPPSPPPSDAPVDASTVPLMWGTGPVPPIQPMPSKKESKDRPLSSRTRSRTTTVVVPTTAKDQPSSTQAASGPSRPQPLQPPRPQPRQPRPPVRPRPIEPTPVTLTGVPGSTHRGVDLVSINFYFC